jgi:flagellar biosynthesis/type III secretory pathway protein FliH
MNAHRLSLEDFTAAPAPDPAPAAEADAVDPGAQEAEKEAARAEGYESGYKTGWDDAVRAAEEERRAIGEELARNLRDVGFTYFEARDEILVGMRAFLRELLDTLFPALLSEASAAGLSEALVAMAEQSATCDVAVSVSPDDADTVRSLLPLPDGVQLGVTEEPALAPGQARLRAADREVSVDADRIVAMLRNALVAVKDDEERSAHG